MFGFRHFGILGAVCFSAMTVCSALAQTAAPAQPGAPAKPETAAPANTPAGAPTQNIDLRYNPAIGSRWINITETRESKKQGSLQSENYTLREKSECVVDSAFTGGFRLKCTLAAMTLEGLHPFANIMKYMGKVMQGVPMIIDTNDRGLPIQIANFEEIKTRCIAGLDEFAKTLKKEQVQELTAIKSTRTQYQNTTAALAPGIYLQDFVALSSAQGLRNTTIGQEHAYVDKTADPQGGGEMRALARFRVTGMDPATGMAIVNWSKEVYDEDLIRSLTIAVQKMKPELPQDAAEFLANMTRASMLFDDKATYYISPADGVARNMERTITIKTESYENRKTTITSFQPAP